MSFVGMIDTLKKEKTHFIGIGTCPSSPFELRQAAFAAWHEAPRMACRPKLRSKMAETQGFEPWIRLWAV
jgi:hypothetical protein